MVTVIASRGGLGQSEEPNEVRYLPNRNWKGFAGRYNAAKYSSCTLLPPIGQRNGHYVLRAGFAYLTSMTSYVASLHLQYHNVLYAVRLLDVCVNGGLLDLPKFSH